MQVQAILYTSNAGHTARYAQLLGRRTGLPVYELSGAAGKLEDGAPVIYLGWLRANKVTGYARARKRYRVLAVCGVGLCDCGALLDEVRSANAIAPQVPLFTLQGGLDRARLRGFNRVLIALLTRALSGNKNLSEGQRRMRDLLSSGGDFVREENLDPLLRLLQQ